MQEWNCRVCGRDVLIAPVASKTQADTGKLVWLDAQPIRVFEPLHSVDNDVGVVEHLAYLPHVCPGKTAPPVRR
jgi:hypothetical protein